MIATMIEAALRSLLVALAVWAGLRVLRVRNVLAQKTCWGLVLVVSLFMPLLVSWSSRWQVVAPRLTLMVRQNPLPLLSGEGPSPNLGQGIQPTRRLTPDRLAKSHGSSDVAPALEPPRLQQASRADSVSDSSNPIASIYEDAPRAQTPSAKPLQIRKPLSVSVLASIVYLVVAGLLTLRILFGLASAFSLWLNATPIPVADPIEFPGDFDLRFSAVVASPVTIGSAVVLPADYSNWDRTKLRIVLAHERSHIRQGDFYLQLLAALYAAAFWLSPLGWWLKRELSDLAETISDRAGLAQATNGSSYAQLLLEFATAPRPTPIGVAMARKGSLSRRIERLLNDGSFRQAFAGGRRRMLVAFFLVPLALFAATCLVRVQAAQQPAPAQPVVPPVQIAPAAQPAPQPQAQEPTSGVSDPHPAPVESDEPVAAPQPPVVALVPPGPWVPPAAPAVQSMTMIPMASPVIQVAPMPPTPLAAPQVLVDMGRLSVLGRDEKPMASYQDQSSYHESSGDDYAVVSGPNRDNFQFSGQIHTWQIDKARKLAHGDFLWFTHDDKEYYVDDPATIAKIEAMYKPIEELGKQQEALGRQQEELGKQQEALGRLQEQASIPTPDLTAEMAKLNAAMAKLQSRIGKTITQDELGEIQEKIGELQAKLGDLQGLVGAKQGELGARQGSLGEQQGKLGAEQGRLGAEQGRLASEADRAVRSIIDQSLHDGKAHPVE
jgi:beta-lactamase regulating signal transducer with metallopeptidase domain